MSKMKVALMRKISGKTAKKRLNMYGGCGMWEDPNKFCFHFPRIYIYRALSYLRYGLQQAGCTDDVRSGETPIPKNELKAERAPRRGGIARPAARPRMNV